MEVILLKDVEKLGQKGAVVNVRDGFGRNFLFPHSLALPATHENKAWLEEEKKRASKKKTKARVEAEKLEKGLSSVKLQFEMAAGEGDKLFGSVTAQDVAEALSQKGFSIDRKKIRLTEALKTLGTHSVTVELHSQVKVNVKLEIVKAS